MLFLFPWELLYRTVSLAAQGLQEEVPQSPSLREGDRGRWYGTASSVPATGT